MGPPSTHSLGGGLGLDSSQPQPPHQGNDGNGAGMEEMSLCKQSARHGLGTG